MTYEKQKEEWLKEERQAFEGWDFSHLDGRWDGLGNPWDYVKIINQYRKNTDTLLDMGTGGGEFLMSIGHPYRLTSVTEAYPPNAELCRQKLSPLGINVRQITKDSELPFEDSAFDIILNRHESFDENEVFRILKPDGIFISQQVGGENNRELSEKLIAKFQPSFPDWYLKTSRSKLIEKGFEILFSDESFRTYRFFDVGAVVFYAKIIKWEFPGFSVERCFPLLCTLYEEWKENGFIESKEHRFIIVSRKQA